MWVWLKNIFNRLLKVFRQFIEEAFHLSTKMIVAEFKECAVRIVLKLAQTDFSDEEKRRQAFEYIKEEADARGRDISTSVINILIELAVQYMKNR